MVKLLDKAILEVVSVIKNSNDYKQCVVLKNKMKNNKELMDIIEQIKEVQKLYIKTGNNKELLDSLEEKLNNFPIYVTYMNHLEKVNEMISYVEDDLNQFIDKLVN